MIGIGITTFNRSDCLMKMLQNNTAAFNRKLVIISDDGSTDSTQDVLQSFPFKWITGKNIGVAGNKNRLFSLLKDCDYIFMADDDVLISRDFEQLYLKAMEKSKIQHFTYNFPGEHWGAALRSSVFDDIVINHTEYAGGAFSFYTKKVIEECGGYTTWSHRDFSKNIWTKGFAGEEIVNHIAGSEKLIKLMDVKSSLKDRSAFKRFNNQLRK